MLVSGTPKVGDDVIKLCDSVRVTVYPCTCSLKGVAITELAQELIKHSSEATECLQSDAKPPYGGCGRED